MKNCKTLKCEQMEKHLQTMWRFSLGRLLHVGEIEKFMMVVLELKIIVSPQFLKSLKDQLHAGFQSIKKIQK